MKKCFYLFLFTNILVSLVIFNSAQVIAQEKPTNDDIANICKNFIIKEVKKDSFNAQELLGLEITNKKK